MKELLIKYENKLTNEGLCGKDAVIACSSDNELIWNKKSKYADELTGIIKAVNTKALIFSETSEPYSSIINYISESADIIRPEDSESRMFLSDIPVINEFSPEQIINKLKNRRCVIVKGYGVLACGYKDIKEAFLIFSSVCFACYVKFFVDAYYKSKNNILTSSEKEIIKNALKEYEGFLNKNNDLSITCAGSIDNEPIIMEAIAEAGRLTIRSRLVNSFFGNISVKSSDSLYITETGSALDELDGHIVKCSLDDTPCEKASSELPAHKEIYRKTKYNSILHGHPRFAVIMSMICDDLDCKFRGECYIKCPKQRFIEDVPIVPGEVGGGRYGLSNTVPNAINDKRGVIVYGHGIFTAGYEHNFIEPFANLLAIEKMCFEEYIKSLHFSAK